MRLPPLKISPKALLSKDLLCKAEELGPPLARAGHYLEGLDFNALTPQEQTYQIEIHELGLLGEMSFWHAFNGDPWKAVERAEDFLDDPRWLPDFELYGAVGDVKTQRRQEELSFCGLRVPLDQLERSTYDVYVHVYDVTWRGPQRNMFRVMGFARKTEVLDADTKQYRKYRSKWIHYHKLHPFVDLMRWKTTTRTLAELTYNKDWVV